MNIELLAFFIRIHEKDGLAAAGQEFGYSPATASAKLATLEDHYQAKLIQRTTRSLSLTEEGLLLLERAKHIVAEAQDLEQAIQYGATNLSGHIKISATHDFGQNRLAHCLDEFIETHPGVTIHLHLSDGYVDMVNDRIDLALRFGALKDSGMISRKIGPNRRVVCAAPEYLKTAGTPKHPNDLADHNCLLIQFDRRVDNDWRFLVGRRRMNVRVSGDRTASSGELIRRWCLQGKGIAYKSIWDVETDLNAGRLVELLNDFQPNTGSHLQAVYPGGGRPPRRVTALMDHLTQCLKKSPL